MTHSGSQALEDFIAGCGQASGSEALWGQAHRFFTAFGARRSIYLHLPPLGAADTGRVEVYAQNCAPDWSGRYRGRNLYRQDPLIRRALRRTDPVVWSDIRRLGGDNGAQRAVLGFYGETGFASGLSVPVFGPGGRNGFVTIGFGEGANETPEGVGNGGDAPARLQAACQAAHLRHCALIRQTQVEPPALSQRERELLYWVARGKSNGVIAEIMQISPHTVDAYMRRVFLKLGTTDRISAALRALGEGLITGY